MWQLGFAWNGARDGMKSAQAMTNLRSLSSPSSILIFLMYLDNHESKVCFHQVYHLVMAWHGPAQSKYISTIVNRPCSSYRKYIYFVLQRKTSLYQVFLTLVSMKWSHSCWLLMSGIQEGFTRNGSSSDLVLSLLLENDDLEIKVLFPEVKLIPFETRSRLSSGSITISEFSLVSTSIVPVLKSTVASNEVQVNFSTKIKLFIASGKLCQWCMNYYTAVWKRKFYNLRSDTKIPLN